MKVVHSLQTILSAAAVHKAVIIWLSGTASDYLPLIIIENLWIWSMLLDNISSSLSLFFFRKHVNTVYSNIIYSHDCLFVLSFWHLQLNDCLIYFYTLYPFLIAVGYTLRCCGKDNEEIILSSLCQVGSKRLPYDMHVPCSFQSPHLASIIVLPSVPFVVIIYAIWNAL